MLGNARESILNVMKRIEAHDFEALSHQYAGRWVAIDPGTRSVVADGKTAKEVFDAARQKGVTVPVVTKIQEQYRSFVA